MPDGGLRAGIAALARGAPAVALAHLQAVVEGPEAPLARLNLGIALQALGRLAEAIPPLEAAQAALPNHPEPPFRLGTIAGLRGEGERARGLLAEAVRHDPSHIPALAALAALAEAAGDLPGARGLLARARALDPAEPELHLAEARLTLAEGQAGAAAAAAAGLLAAHPDHAAAGTLWAEAMLAAEGPEAAAAALAGHAAAAPFAAGWAMAAARLHRAAGCRTAALAELRTAAALAPARPDIRTALALALADARAPEAEAALRAAIAASPAELDLRNRLATVLWKANRPAAMLDLLDAAIGDFGPHPTLLMNRALALNGSGEQAAALASAEAAIAGGGGLAALVNRMAVQPYHPTAGTGPVLRRAAEEIAAALGPPPPRPTRRAGGGPLRIGLLSGGLGQHPVGWLTLAGLEALPAGEFTLAAYALKPRTDPLAQRFRARCALWREVAEADDAAIAAQIAADGIDILLDLGGYGEGGRPFVLHHRPAPVQVKWVGAQCATTGLPAVDWLLTDRWETPPGAEAHYTERLLRLPDGYVCYLPPPYAPAVTPARPDRPVTFGCFNNLAKLSPPVLDAWAAILAAVPDSRLLLRTHALGEAATRDRLARRLAAAGLPGDRVLLDGGLSHLRLLAAYGEVDIALDPFPYTGGLTLCESLWMGVPAVTLAGDSFCARHATSHLSNLGLTDWVAADPAGYVALAIAKARDRAGLAALRASLRPRMAASPLTDPGRFGQGLAAALRHAWAVT